VIDSRSRWPPNGRFCGGWHERRARIGPHLTENRNPVDFGAILETPVECPLLRQSFPLQHSPLTFTCEAAERPMPIGSTCGVTSVPLKAQMAR
jgi:hypothetical protein